MEIVKVKSLPARVKKVEKLLLSAGNQIGSVWFHRRTDGSLRKMAFRLHCTNPTYAPVPKGENFKKRKAQDSDNMQMTVLDVNKVLRASKGRRKGLISGRGAYRTVPMENVIRIKVNGTIHKIKA